MKDPYQFNAKAYDLTLLKDVGTDVFISTTVEIRRPSLMSIGNHVAIDSGFYITTTGDFGDYIHIGPHVAVIGGLLGKLTLQGFNTIGAGTKIICASDSFSGEALVTAPGIPERMVEVKASPVVLERFASIGANAVIFHGVTIKEGSVIGAGSVVRHDTEPWTVYAGNPAQPIKIRPKEKMIAYADELRKNDPVRGRGC